MPPLRHDVDWRPVAGRVVWVPPAYREPTVDAAAAQRLLRCTPESFARLVDLGLPAAASPDGPRYDLCDLRNAALFAGAGVTTVEVAMGTVFRYMRADRYELTRPRAWQVTLTATGAPGAAVPVWRPTPETCGGDPVELRTPDGAVAATDGDRVLVPAGGGVGGRVVTRGTLRPLRSAVVRRVTADLLGSGVRWHAVPPALDFAPDDALPLGIGGCVTLSVALERALRAAGYDAVARLGWLAGALEATHAWVEVVDDDGEVRWLDPSLALLADMLGAGGTEFRDLVLGSAVNRLVPTRGPASAGPSYGAPPGCEVRFACREVPLPDAATALAGVP